MSNGEEAILSSWGLNYSECIYEVVVWNNMGQLSWSWDFSTFKFFSSINKNKTRVILEIFTYLKERRLWELVLSGMGLENPARSQWGTAGCDSPLQQEWGSLSLITFNKSDVHPECQRLIRKGGDHSWCCILWLLQQTITGSETGTKTDITISDCLRAAAKHW